MKNLLVLISLVVATCFAHAETVEELKAQISRYRFLAYQLSQTHMDNDFVADLMKMAKTPEDKTFLTDLIASRRLVKNVKVTSLGRDFFIEFASHHTAFITHGKNPGEIFVNSEKFVFSPDVPLSTVLKGIGGSTRDSAGLFWRLQMQAALAADKYAYTPDEARVLALSTTITYHGDDFQHISKASEFSAKDWTAKCPTTTNKYVEVTSPSQRMLYVMNPKKYPTFAGVYIGPKNNDPSDLTGMIQIQNEDYKNFGFISYDTRITLGLAVCTDAQCSKTRSVSSKDLKDNGFPLGLKGYTELKDLTAKTERIWNEHDAVLKQIMTGKVNGKQINTFFDCGSSKRCQNFGCKALVECRIKDGAKDGLTGKEIATIKDLNVRLKAVADMLLEVKPLFKSEFEFPEQVVTKGREHLEIDLRQKVWPLIKDGILLVKACVPDQGDLRGDLARDKNTDVQPAE